MSSLSLAENVQALISFDSLQLSSMAKCSRHLYLHFLCGIELVCTLTQGTRKGHPVALGPLLLASEFDRYGFGSVSPYKVFDYLTLQAQQVLGQGLLRGSAPPVHSVQGSGYLKRIYDTLLGTPWKTYFTYTSGTWFERFGIRAQMKAVHPQRGKPLVLTLRPLCFILLRVPSSFQGLRSCIWIQDRTETQCGIEFSPFGPCNFVKFGLT